MIDTKTNEIPTIPLLIDRLKINGTIVTWDALNTQRENIKKVISAKADYVVPTKANQGTFYSNIELYFDEKRLEMIIAGNNNSSYKKEIEKSHSRCITYEYFQTSDVSWYEEKEKWKKLYSIGMVRKTIEYNGEITIENRYYISSLDVDIELFSKSIRLHWSVENKLHWHLDFTFREDKNTTANKTTLMNFQLINKFKELSFIFLSTHFGWHGSVNCHLIVAYVLKRPGILYFSSTIFPNSCDFKSISN
mgnify:CR=1 FL=1